MRFKPYDYQTYTIERLLDNKRHALILEMGLGKTVCTLTAINELALNRFEVNKVLVIAPLNVATMTWPEELEKWSHLRQLRYSIVAGKDAKGRVEALNAKADIYLINRENVEWLIRRHFCKDQVTPRKKNPWPYDMIVVDESSSFKDANTVRFGWLRKVRLKSERFIELTGTPAPRSLEDLWAQIYLLDDGKRLGRYITAYRDAYFYPGARNKGVVYEWKLKDGAEKRIYRKIGDIAVSMRSVDHIKMPERIDNFIRLTMPEEARKYYEELEAEYLVDIDEDTITAESAGVVVGKLLQMANGAVYDEDKKVIQIHDIKLEALSDILDFNENVPVLVYYTFKHDADRIMERFKKIKPRRFKTAQDKADYLAGNLRLMIAHPASVGHGVNLQTGEGHIIVWFGLTNDLELYLQANARLHRPGNKHTVIINHLIVKDTEDEATIARIQRKQATQEDLIKALRAKIRKYKNQVRKNV